MATMVEEPEVIVEETVIVEKKKPKKKKRKKHKRSSWSKFKRRTRKNWRKVTHKSRKSGKKSRKKVKRLAKKAGRGIKKAAKATKRAVVRASKFVGRNTVRAVSWVGLAISWVIRGALLVVATAALAIAVLIEVIVVTILSALMYLVLGIQHVWTKYVHGTLHWLSKKPGSRPKYKAFIKSYQDKPMKKVSEKVDKAAAKIDKSMGTEKTKTKTVTKKAEPVYVTRHGIPMRELEKENEDDPTVWVPDFSFEEIPENLQERIKARVDLDLADPLKEFPDTAPTMAVQQLGEAHLSHPAAHFDVLNPIWDEVREKGGPLNVDYSKHIKHPELLDMLKGFEADADTLQEAAYWAGRAYLLERYLAFDGGSRVIDHYGRYWALRFNQLRNKQDEYPLPAYRTGFMDMVADIKTVIVPPKKSTAPPPPKGGKSTAKKATPHPPPGKTAAPPKKRS